MMRVKKKKKKMDHIMQAEQRKHGLFVVLVTIVERKEIVAIC